MRLYVFTVPESWLLLLSNQQRFLLACQWETCGAGDILMLFDGKISRPAACIFPTKGEHPLCSPHAW